MYAIFKKMEEEEDVSSLSIKTLRQKALLSEAVEEWELAIMYYSEALQKISMIDGDETKNMAVLDFHYGYVLLQAHKEDRMKALESAETDTIKEDVEKAEEDLETIKEDVEEAEEDLEDEEEEEKDEEKKGAAEEFEMQVEEKQEGESSGKEEEKTEGENAEEEEPTKIELARSVLEVTTKVLSKPKFDEDLEAQSVLMQTYNVIAEVEAEFVMYHEAIQNYQFALCTLEKGFLPRLPTFESNLHLKAAAFWLKLIFDDMSDYQNVAQGQAKTELHYALSILECVMSGSRSSALVSRMDNIKKYIQKMEELTTESDKEVKEIEVNKLSTTLLMAAGCKVLDKQQKYGLDAIEPSAEIQDAVKKAVEKTFPESCGSASKGGSPFKNSGLTSNVASPTKIANFGPDGDQASQPTTNISHLVRRKPADKTSTVSKEKKHANVNPEQVDSISRLKSAILADETLKRKAGEADCVSLVNEMTEVKKSKKGGEDKDAA